MITVIEHGPKKIKARCPHCGCIFEYELEDVKSDGIISLSTIQYNNTGQYVECPDCEYHVYHDYFKLDEPKAPDIRWYKGIGDSIPCFMPGDYVNHSTCTTYSLPKDEQKRLDDIQLEINRLSPCSRCSDDANNPKMNCSECKYNRDYFASDEDYLKYLQDEYAYKKQEDTFTNVLVEKPKTCEECPAYCQTYRVGYSPCDICPLGNKHREKPHKPSQEELEDFFNNK